MAVNSKLITLPSLLLASGSDGDSYATLLKSLEIGKLKELFTRTFTPGQEVILKDEDLDNISYAMFSLSIEQFLRSKVKDFVDNFELEKRVDQVTNGIFDELSSQAIEGLSHPGKERFYKLSRCKTQFLMSEDKNLVAWNNIYLAIHQIMNDKIVSLYNRLSKMIYMSGQLQDSSISLLGQKIPVSGVRTLRGSHNPSRMMQNKERPLTD